MSFADLTSNLENPTYAVPPQLPENTEAHEKEDQQDKKRMNAYDIWLAAFPVFVQGYRRMQMTNKTKDFWTSVAKATGYYKSKDTAQNRFRDTMRNWVKKAMDLAGPDNTGGGAIDYVELTKIKNVPNHKIKKLVDDYASIIGDDRKWKTKDECSTNSTTKPPPKTGTAAAWSEMNDLKKRSLDMLEDSDILNTKRLKYETDNRKAKMQQLQIASKEKRMALLAGSDEEEMVVFWTEQEQTLKEELQFQ